MRGTSHAPLGAADACTSVPKLRSASTGLAPLPNAGTTSACAHGHVCGLMARACDERADPAAPKPRAPCTAAARLYSRDGTTRCQGSTLTHLRPVGREGRPPARRRPGTQTGPAAACACAQDGTRLAHAHAHTGGAASRPRPLRAMRSGQVVRSCRHAPAPSPWGVGLSALALVHLGTPAHPKQRNPRPHQGEGGGASVTAAATSRSTHRASGRSASEEARQGDKFKEDARDTGAARVHMQRVRTRRHFRLTFRLPWLSATWAKANATRRRRNGVRGSSSGQRASPRSDRRGTSKAGGEGAGPQGWAGA